MRGLVAKALQEVWVATLIFGVALAGVMALLTFLLPQIQAGMDGVLESLPFVRGIMAAVLGTEVGEEITARAMQSLLWVHPTVLALIWAHEITLCTRTPAGEIDRGTIDFLLSLPVSRWKVYLSESVVWLTTGAFVLTLGYLGHRVAAPSMPQEMRPEPMIAARVLFNLYLLYFAVGAFALLVSSASNRRGWAMAFVFGVVIASFLLNFTAQLWEPAKPFAILGVMQYYRPAEIMKTHALAWGDLAVLFACGAVAWTAAGLIFARRSICTV